MKLSSQHFFWGILILVCVLHGIVWYLFPFAHTDAFGTIGQIFHEKSSFPTFNYFYNSGNVYVTGYLALPFFLLYDGVHSVFYFYGLFSASAAVLLALYAQRIPRYFDDKSISLGWLIAFGLVCNYTLFIQRSEPIALFIIALWMFCFKAKNRSFPALLLFSMLSFFIHPVSTLVLGFMVLGYYLFSDHKDGRKPFKESRGLWLISSVILLLGVLYFTQTGVWEYYKGHIEMRLSNFSLLPFILFAFKSLSFIYLVFKGVKSLNLKRFILLCALVLAMLGRDFYFIYLFALLLFLWSVFPALFSVRSVSVSVFTVLLSFDLFFSLINPLIQRIENKELTKVAYQILNHVNRQEAHNQIFCAPHIAAPLLHRNGIRQFFIEESSCAILARGELQNADILLFTNPLEANCLLNQYPNSEIDTLVYPSKGYVSFRSFYQQRQEQVGLFRIVLSL